VEFHDTLEDQTQADLEEESRLKPFPMSWKRKKMSPKMNVDFSMPLEAVMAHTISTDSIPSLRKSQSDNTLHQRKFSNYDKVRHTSDYVISRAIARLSQVEAARQTYTPKLDFSEPTGSKGTHEASLCSEPRVSKKSPEEPKSANFLYDESRGTKKSIVEPLIPQKPIVEPRGITKISIEEPINAQKYIVDPRVAKNPITEPRLTTISINKPTKEPVKKKKKVTDSGSGLLDSLKPPVRKSTRIIPQAWVSERRVQDETASAHSATIKPPVHQALKTSDSNPTLINFRRRARSEPNIQKSDQLRVRFVDYPLSDFDQQETF